VVNFRKGIPKQVAGQLKHEAKSQWDWGRAGRRGHTAG